MTSIEVERTDPAEALRRIRARLVERNCELASETYDLALGEQFGVVLAIKILDEEWPAAAVTE